MEYSLEKISHLTIDLAETLVAAMKQMDENDCKSLLVTEHGTYLA